jgi:putative ABC transport system permease protein
VIYVPFSVAQKLKPNADDIYILAVARAGRMEEAKDQVRDTLRVRRQVPFAANDNFGMETSESILDNFRSITAGLAIAMVVISSVGLMVGGIGVMNIMLVSVTERTREIGVRKAIGARRADIMWQFLIEAATLTGLGGIVGLSIGWGLTLLLRLLLPSYVPLWAPVGGLIASVGIGLIFGLWPAGKQRVSILSNLCVTSNAYQLINCGNRAVNTVNNTIDKKNSVSDTPHPAPLLAFVEPRCSPFARSHNP